MSESAIQRAIKNIRLNCENNDIYDLVITYYDDQGSERLVCIDESDSVNGHDIWHLEISTCGLKSVEALQKIEDRKREIKLQLNLSSGDKLIVTEANNGPGNVYIHMV